MSVNMSISGLGRIPSLCLSAVWSASSLNSTKEGCERCGEMRHTASVFSILPVCFPVCHVQCAFLRHFPLNDQQCWTTMCFKFFKREHSLRFSFTATDTLNNWLGCSWVYILKKRSWVCICASGSCPLLNFSQRADFLSGRTCGLVGMTCCVRSHSS